MGYSKRVWVCPFYRNDKKLSIHCEAGSAAFPNYRELARYARDYCGNVANWKRCSLAAARCQFYDRE